MCGHLGERCEHGGNPAEPFASRSRSRHISDAAGGGKIDTRVTEDREAHTFPCAPGEAFAIEEQPLTMLKSTDLLAEPEIQRRADWILGLRQ